MAETIQAHGGTLIQRQLKDAEREEMLRESASLHRLQLTPWAISDLEMIGIGAFSPLTGFMGSADWASVLDTMHLASGAVWSIPVTLPVSEEDAKQLKPGQKLALTGADEMVYGILEIDEVYPYDRDREAQAVFGTTDPNHPGVERVLNQHPYYVAGPIWLLNRKSVEPFSQYTMDPIETRAMFQELGWRTVVGFQTRNPIHRAHEYIQKIGLEVVDGLLLHPLVGQTKADDVPAEVRLKSYLTLLEYYYPKNRVLFSVYPAAMRYAGPREAVFHAMARKNFGCTHFIVGRDHAGVGNYYGTYDAQKIFSNFTPEELGITPLFFENSFYCHKCDGMASEKTCPHGPEDRVILSGTKVREMLRNGQRPSPKFTRPEVADILVSALSQNRA